MGQSRSVIFAPVQCFSTDWVGNGSASWQQTTEETEMLKNYLKKFPMVVQQHYVGDVGKLSQYTLCQIF